MLHPICSLRARIPFLRFFHLNALISFFSSTVNVTLFLFFFPVESPHKSLLPLSILLLLPSFILLNVLLPLSFLFVVLVIAAAAVFAFFFRFSQTQCHISIDFAVFESSSSFSFQVFVFLVLSSLLSFLSHACWKVTVNFFELIPAASFTCASVASLISLCLCLHLTTRSLSFVSSFLSPLSTAHSRCDEFYGCHFSI